MSKLFIFLLYLFSTSFSVGENKNSETDYFYTSVFSLNKLVTTQAEIVQKLKHYIKNEEHNLVILTNYWIHFKTFNATFTSPRYLKNPLNSFALINRLKIDTDFIENITSNTEFCTRNLVLPYAEDLAGAAMGLVRIQTTYQIDVAEMTSCTYKKFNCTPMTSSDCYELARSLFRLGNNMNNGLIWVQEALKLYKDSDIHVYSIERADLYKNIAYAYIWLNDTANATVYVDKIINEEISTLTREELHKTLVLKSMIQAKEVELFTHGIELPTMTDHDKFLKKFDKVCREEANISHDISKQLNCRYFTNNHPFLRLAPVKMEQLYVMPDIILFYDIVHEIDINVFKNRLDPIWEDIPKLKGNRLATFILYISNVEEGGHTVFPHLGLKINPRKGTAVFFTNLLQTGDGDLDTMHAACPVVQGDKWIVTKWIHEVGQELKKSCDLVHYNRTPKAILPRGMMKITGYPSLNYR